MSFFILCIFAMFLQNFHCHFTEFLEEMSGVQAASINEVPPGHNTNPPVLIHCSEGGGRSGVTLAADLLLYTMDHNQVIHFKNKKNLLSFLMNDKFVFF